MAHHIRAVSVNHNTSPYRELMLRSLYATHASSLSLSMTVFDNASTDDRAGLQTYATQQGIPIIQSGWTTETQNNSHGEILGRFVRDHPDCMHYLFLDADICFIEDNTIGCIVDELEQSQDAFGIGARFSWDGIAEIPAEIRHNNPDVYEARLHPCCALVKNTPLFRRVVLDIGLGSATYLWPDRDEYLDTFKLITRVMGTHGLRHMRSAKMVIHFFTVSYDFDPEQVKAHKARQRDERLRRLRKIEQEQA